MAYGVQPSAGENQDGLGSKGLSVMQTFGLKCSILWTRY